jgi:endonuclease YncB( thermonuclease family)
MRRRLLLIVLLCLLAPATADAARAPMHQWTGRVTFIADGDTIDVDVDGDGTHAARPIRITGINAPELTRYSKYPSRRRGECHGVAAAARLESLIRRAHGRVRLSAQDPASRSGHRLRRAVAVRSGRGWLDAGGVLVGEGYALWLPNATEWAFNDDYRRLSLQAEARGLRLWDPQGCAPVPAPDARLSMQVNWDADGNDFQNVDGEWMRVRNDSPAPVALDGWWVRDSALRRFTFPRGTVVGAGRSVTVYVGRGRDGASDFYWGLASPAFENAGDGGYLFDRRGNLRAADIYPGS